MGLLKAILGRVDLDGSGFERGALKVEHVAERMGKNVAHELSNTVGGALAGLGVGELIRGIVESVSRFHKLSEEFRVSTDTIQTWDKAANRVGETAETVGDAFNKAKKAREAAIGGDNKIAGAFGKLGVSMETLRDASISTEAILNQISNSFAGRAILDDADVAGMEVFGKSGAKVLSVFEQLHNLGPVNLIPKEDIEKMTELEHKFQAAKTQAQAWGASLAGWAVKNLIEKPAAFLGNLAGGEHDIRQAFLNARRQVDGDGPGGPGRKPGSVNTHGMTFGPPKDEKKAAEELRAIEAERKTLAEKILANQLVTLNTKQKIAALEAEIAKHQKEGQSLSLQGGKDKEALKELQTAETLRGQLIELARKPGKNLQVDSINKIGGFVGGGESVIAGIQREALHVAKQQASTTQKILDEIVRTNPGGSSLVD